VITVVVLGKYSDIFEGCRKSLDRFAPGLKKILVRDGHDISSPPGWLTIQGPQKFSMAGNANIGWRAVTEGDILYMGDDARINSSFDKLIEVADMDLKIGILSPKIVGGVGNPIQKHPGPFLHYTKMLCFVCVLIRRAVIDKVGYLNERFVKYGYDDDDYSRRTLKAGFALAATSVMSVNHLDGQTFRRNYQLNGGSMESDMSENFEIFKELHC
jgi:hypothetical protein